MDHCNSFKFCVVNGPCAEQNRRSMVSSPCTAILRWKDEFVSQNLRFPATEPDQNQDGIPRELVELGQLIHLSQGPGRAELEVAFQRIVESVRRRHRILVLVQEALSQLRLDIKYLMFDLDVTRRERDELRQQLEEQ